VKEEVKVVELDRAEENCLLTALVDLRNRRLQEGKTADFVGELITEIAEAPTRKVKIRGDAR
jgi:hypothetical protein